MSTPPPPGTICRAHPVGPDGHPALVLVITHLSEAHTRVRLLSNEVEMASDADHVLAPDGQRSYALVVLHFPVYVRAANLSTPLYTVNLDGLTSCGAPPLTGRQDPRWAWQLAELDRSRHLQPPLAELL